VSVAGPGAPAPHRRLVIVALGLVGLAASVAALQSSFDAGDRRRALAALDTTPTATGTSLAEALRRRNGGAAARCAAEVVSSARGLTRVTCLAGGQPPYVFRWDDLRRDGLRPDDEATRRRLEP
jgi:hypothetical protein